jgi:hypothetical protein
MITLEKNGLQKRVSTGYSWKALMFGCLYPIARGDYGGALRHFIYMSVSFGLSYLITPFLYNKKYIRGLIEDKDWKPSNLKSKMYLMNKFNYKG